MNSTGNNFVDEWLAFPSSKPSFVLSSQPSMDLRIGSIAGNVKEDTDNDDIGEVNLPGVLISLLDTTGSVIATTLTDTAGNYLFSDLPFSTYRVLEENLPEFDDVSDVDGTNDNIVVVVLTSTNLNSTRNDFVDERRGTPAPAVPTASPGPSASPSSNLLGSIAGNVQEDIDNDNIGEQNIPNVLITLADSTGTAVATTRTDSEGNYLFADLPVGLYSVRETDPVQLFSVSDVDGPNDNTISVSLTFTNLNSTRNDFVDERIIAESPSSVPSLSFSPSQFCNDRVFIGFETAGNGTRLAEGAYVKDEWKIRYGLTVSASSASGFTPEGMPRIFDTSNPGTINSGGDADLGSPNNRCLRGGPGVGDGGQPGENCVPQGNVLIIQESNKVSVDDNAQGGRICFDFESLVEVFAIGFIDISPGTGNFVVVTSGTSGSTTTIIPGLGENAVETVRINKIGVSRVCANLIAEGGITGISFCNNFQQSSIPSSKPSILPSQAPSSLATVFGSIFGNVKEDVDNDDIGERNLPGVMISLLDSNSATNCHNNNEYRRKLSFH